MNCPSGKEWKALVQKYGEFEAYKIYIANGEEVPFTQEVLSPKNKAKAKLQAVIDVKKEEIKLRYKRLARAKNNLKKAETIDDRLRYTSIVDKIQNSIDNANEVIEDLEKKSDIYDIEEYALADLEEVGEILDQDNLSWEDMVYVQKKLSLWQKAGDFTDRDHLFFDVEEFKQRKEALKDIADKFTDWRLQAEEYEIQLNKIREDAIEIAVKEEFGNNVELDFKKALFDVNKLTSLTLDISEVDNALLQAMHSWYKKSTKQANFESQERFKQIDSLIEKATPKLERSGYRGLYDVFKQTFSNTDKRETGDLVSRFSQSFFDTKRSIFNKARKTNSKTSWRKAFNWTKHNEIQFDVRKLFQDKEMYDKETFSDKDIEEHKQELINTLGQEGYNFYIERVEEKIKDYKFHYNSIKRDLEAKYGADTARIQSELNSFEISNSPYYHAHYSDVGYVKINGKYSKPTGKYSQSVPKRIIDSKDTGYYDNKFNQIQSDKDLLNLYNYMVELMKETKGYLPGGKTLKMHMNTIPYIKKTILEQLEGKKYTKGLGLMWDNIKEATRVDDLSQVAHEYIDPNLGTVDKELQTQFIVNTEQKVQDYIDVQKIKYKQETGNNPSYEQLIEFRKDAQDKIAKEKSFDLGKVMKAYSMMGLTFHHKGIIEDQMKIANHIIQNNIKEQRENKAGDILYDEYGKPLNRKGLDNMKSMLDYFMNGFFGYPMQKVELKTKKKLYTKEEDKRIKELQDLLNTNEQNYNDGRVDGKEYINTKETINKQLEQIGGVLTGHLIGNQLLKWVQLKGIGWNLFSAVSNMGFGFISNITEAVDGRNFNQEQYWKALALVRHSIGKNFTFNKYETGTAKKIRSLMDKFDILKESRNEIFQASKGHSSYSKLQQKFKWLNPYNMQARGEYVNQAPIMIAMMMNTKVKTTNGEEINLWEAYDEDGNLQYDIEDKTIKDLGVKIDKVIKINHGNYDPDSHIQVKETILGRALSQFRTWAFEGFATRFEKEFDDNQLGFKRKGRYRSGFMFLSYADNPGMNGFEQTYFTTKQLLRKLRGKNTQFEEAGFSKVDAANLRKNLTETVLYMGLMAIGLLVKASIDDDDKKKNFLLRANVNFLLHQFNRLETDILFYTNPMEFEKLQKNAAPIFSLVVDGYKWGEAVVKLLQGEDEIRTGVTAGESRIFKATARLFPGTTQYPRIKSVIEKEF